MRLSLSALSFLPSQRMSGSGRAGGSTENGDAATVRKVHKADREKLRRDRLNEQFGELAGVLGTSSEKLEYPIFCVYYYKKPGCGQCRDCVTISARVPL